MAIFLRTGCAWAADTEEWKRIANDDGIAIDTREITGMNMPAFRGTTVVRGGIYDVAAILDDMSRYCEWTKRCITTKELHKYGEFDRVFYHRTGTPWPLKDRDCVFRGKVSGLLDGVDVMVAFESIRWPHMPPKDDAVRMPTARGHYHLTRIDAGNTRVEFMIQADPGGIVPQWAANLSAKAIPADTLAGLRRQVVKTRGKYENFVKRFTDEKPATVPDLPAKAAPAP